MLAFSKAVVSKKRLPEVWAVKTKGPATLLKVITKKKDVFQSKEQKKQPVSTTSYYSQERLATILSLLAEQTTAPSVSKLGRLPPLQTCIALLSSQFTPLLLLLQLS